MGEDSAKLLALRAVVVALMSFGPVRNQHVLEEALDEYLHAALDEFRARGLTCPHCERRIEEWPIQDRA